MRSRTAVVRLLVQNMCTLSLSLILNRDEHVQHILSQLGSYAIVPTYGISFRSLERNGDLYRKER